MSTSEFSEKAISPLLGERLRPELTAVQAGLAERSILASLERIAALDPAHPAVIDGAVTLSRAELVAKARRVAAALIQCGLPPGPIGLLVPDGAAHVIALLGFLGAGRLFLPLDYAVPHAARAAAVKAFRPIGVLVLAADTAEAGAFGLPTIVFETCLNGEDPGMLPEVDPSAPAVIASTSGTTGAAKGVVHSQRNLVEALGHKVALTGIGPDDVFLSIAPNHTKGSVNQRLETLLAGATLLLSDIQAEGLGGVLTHMERAHVSFLRATPMVMKAITHADGAPAALAALRFIHIGGDLLLRDDLADIVAALPVGCRVYATLASSEVRIADWVVDLAAVDDPVRVAGGLPRQGTLTHVVDEAGHLVMDDAPGELIVHSRFAALGDWIDGRLVSDRFPPDPQDPSRRIVRTGDLARRAPSGRLVIVGRKDRMVKIRGQRVEPALVEAAILRVPRVSYASVQAQRDGANARLIAFVVAERGAATMASVVRQALRAILPEYMCPARIIEVGALPLRASGKIDSAALLQLAEADATQPPLKPAAAGRASAAAERAVATAWRRVLGVLPAPGVTFLDASGDSLQLLELVFELEIRTGRRLPLDEFNAEASAAEMALALDSALRRPASSASSGVFLLPGARGDTPGLAGLRADCLAVASMQLLAYPDWREMLREWLTVEGIVESAVAQIRAISPAGLLCLVGYSFGVHIAFAAACMLESEGREVAQLVLIDMPPPQQRKTSTHVWSPLTMMRKVWWEVDQLRRAARNAMAAKRFGMIAATFATWLVCRSGIRPLATSSMTKGWSRLFGDLGYWTSHHMGQEFRLRAAHEWAQRWRAPATRLRAPLLLIRTAAHRQDEPKDFGWKGLAEDVEVVHVPGTHVSMLSTAHRKAVSGAVSAALARALSALNGPPNAAGSAGPRRPAPRTDDGAG